MKKIAKFLSLIAIVALMATMFVGCAGFGKKITAEEATKLIAEASANYTKSMTDLATAGGYGLEFSVDTENEFKRAGKSLSLVAGAKFQANINTTDITKSSAMIGGSFDMKNAWDETGKSDMNQKLNVYMQNSKTQIAAEGTLLTQTGEFEFDWEGIFELLGMQKVEGAPSGDNASVDSIIGKLDDILGLIGTIGGGIGGGSVEEADLTSALLEKYTSENYKLQPMFTIKKSGGKKSFTLTFSTSVKQIKEGAISIMDGSISMAAQIKNKLATSDAEFNAYINQFVTDKLTALNNGKAPEKWQVDAKIAEVKLQLNMIDITTEITEKMKAEIEKIQIPEKSKISLALKVGDSQFKSIKLAYSFVGSKVDGKLDVISTLIGGMLESNTPEIVSAKGSIEIKMNVASSVNIVFPNA